MFIRLPFLRKTVCFGESVTKYITKELHRQREVIISIVSVCMIAALALGGENTLTAFAKTSSREVRNLQDQVDQGIIPHLESAGLKKDIEAIAAAEKMVSIRHGQLVVGYLLTQNVMRQEQAQEALAERYNEMKGRFAESRKTGEIFHPEIPCSSEDYQTLLRIVEAEAGICDSKGKILVANVVINRVRSSEFPDTIREVVYQPSQFSPVSNGTINTCKVTRQTVECVRRALSGEDYSQGALYFMNRGASKSGAVRWFDGRLTYLFSYDGHEFFK